MKPTLFAALSLGLALAAPAQTDGTPSVPTPEKESYWTVEVSGIGG